MSFEEWNSLLQSIGAIATSFTLIFLAWQIKLQKKEMNTNLEYQKREKAIEMCKYYLYQEYWKTLNITQKITMKDFTKTEFLSYFSEDMLNKMSYLPRNFLIEDFFENSLNNQTKFFEIYTEFKKRNYRFYSKKEIEESEEKIKKERRLSNIKLELLGNNLFEKMITKNESVVNKLEYFSMNFISGIADESVVYQSLHQSFFGVLSFFYPQICLANDGTGKDKYYTNLINLYNLWKEREERYKKEEKNLEQTYHSNKSNYL